MSSACMTAKLTQSVNENAAESWREKMSQAARSMGGVEPR